MGRERREEGKRGRGMEIKEEGNGRTNPEPATTGLQFARPITHRGA